MPVVLTFNKLKEKKPEHNQDIIWLQHTGSFDYYGFDPVNTTVEYQWTEYAIDDKGRKLQTGVFYSYNYEESIESSGNITCEIEIVVSTNGMGYVMKEDDLWMDVEDYWKAFE